MTKRSKASKNEPFSVKRALSGGYNETLIRERTVAESYGKNREPSTTFAEKNKSTISEGEESKPHSGSISPGPGILEKRGVETEVTGVWDYSQNTVRFAAGK